MGLIRSDIESLEDSPIVDVWRMGYGNPEVIGMFAGESDVPTPAFICDATSKALAEGRTFYSPNRGIQPMRDALIAYNKRLYGIDLPDGVLRKVYNANALKITPGLQAAFAASGGPGE